MSAIDRVRRDAVRAAIAEYSLSCAIAQEVETLPLDAAELFVDSLRGVHVARGDNRRARGCLFVAQFWAVNGRYPSREEFDSRDEK